MNKAPKLHLLALIADEAIEQIQYGTHNARWLAALMGAISDTLGSDGPAIPSARAERAKALASLGQYLADDLTGYMDARAEELLKQIGAAPKE